MSGHLESLSFPTRRSPDLALRAAPERRRNPAGTRRCAPRRMPARAGLVQAAVIAAAYPHPLAPELRPASADRKSTRLNSSHLVISYAVICLKKKNRIKEAN